MFDMVSGMFCFVTATVSFLYGTRICWVCGKRCSFDVDPTEKKQILKANIPGGFAVYLFGFIVVFSAILNGPLTIATTSLISSLLLSHFVVSMAMPALRRNPSYAKDLLRKAAITNSNKSGADINHRKENSKQEYYGRDKHVKI